MKYEKEIRYWASKPDGTEVFVRAIDGWASTTCPTWYPSMKFVVDDEWAELRKANADGATIQAWDVEVWKDLASDWWKHGFYREIEEGRTTDDFRVKPKPWYERIPEQGVLCRVWDDDREFEQVRVVMKYRANKENPFVAVPKGYSEGPAEIEWQNAEPIRPDDPLIFKEDKEEAKR